MKGPYVMASSKEIARRLRREIGGDAGETIEIADAEDISGTTKPFKLPTFSRWSLFIRVAGAIDIYVELSPDWKKTWFEIPESPLSYTEAGDDVLVMDYTAFAIRLTGSNKTDVTAYVRGNY